MKTCRNFLAVAAMILLPMSSLEAQTLAQWTFESSGLGGSSPSHLPGANTASTNFYAELGLQAGTAAAFGLHVGNATYTSPTGNGSTKSLSANTWAIGDFYQFSLSTIGYQDISLSWAQVSSATGPGEFKLAYQINGGGFTDYLNYTVLPNQAGAPGLGTWSSSTVNSGYNYLVDLSTVTGLNNVTSVDFRLIARSVLPANPTSTFGAGGTDRVDTFTVTAVAVPEPSMLALSGLGALVLMCHRRRN